MALPMAMWDPRSLAGTALATGVAGLTGIAARAFSRLPATGPDLSRAVVRAVTPGRIKFGLLRAARGYARYALRSGMPPRRPPALALPLLPGYVYNNPGGGAVRVRVVVNPPTPGTPREPPAPHP